MTKAAPSLRQLAITLLAVAVTTLGWPSPARSAPPSSPTGLSPNGAVSNTPIFSWDRPGGAVKFQIQIDNADDFSSPTVDAMTTNTTYVVTKPIAGGDQFWRVRAYNATNETSGWSSASLTVSPVAVPLQISPLGGSAPLQQPDDAPLLRWQPVQGASEYTVQVDKEADEIGVKEYKTKTTSLVVPDPLEAGTWNWRVRATRASGVESAFSGWEEFTLTPLPHVTLVAPVNGQSVEDVELDWQPLAGAAWYQLQVASDIDFATIVDSQTKVLGTNYSPAKTYDNAPYYWRVRAVDPNGNLGPWPAQPATFTRGWPDTPLTVFPADADGSSATKDLQEFSGAPFFQWTPVQHATEYELQVSANSNFSTYSSCLVAGTTYTPQIFWVHHQLAQAGYRTEEDCWINPDVELFWRVRPLDLPFTKSGELVPGVQGFQSETERFVWHPNAGATFSPSGGQTVDIPTLRWNFPRAYDKYRIEIKNNSGVLIGPAVMTRATSYTPVNVTALSPAAGPFTWSVTAFDSAGPIAPGEPAHRASLTHLSTFNVSGTTPTTGVPALTPLDGLESDPPTVRAPELRWEPMAGASYYKLVVGPADEDENPGPLFYIGGADDAYQSTKKLPYPAVTDTGARFLTEGSYDWWVQAYNASNQLIGTGPEETFEIAGLAEVTGQSIALDGMTIRTGNGCDAVKPAICDNVPSTPVFSWDPVAGASFYMLYVARDAGFTDVVEPLTNVASTVTTMWAPTLSQLNAALPDSVAGLAYHWFVRPCKTLGDCGPSPVSIPEAAKNQFRKQSPQVVPETPVGQVITTADVTLDWQDYFVTNQATTWAATGEESPQAAQWYQVQIDNDENFSSPLDTILVDQSKYTSATKLFPEGNIYWRVRALDANKPTANNLPWSLTRHVVKQTAAPLAQFPGNGAQVSGATYFEWSATAATAKYHLQVFKGEVTENKSTLLFETVVNGTGVVKQTAYTWDKPIPAASQPYVWRVRRFDPNVPSNDGPWSAVRSFESHGGAPTLFTPSAAAKVPANGPLFTWSDVAGAAAYQIEVKTSSSGAIWANITTAATAWATDRVLPDGAYEWRVTAKDAGGAAIGASGWRPFSVDGTRPTVTSFTPMSSGSPTQNIVVKFSEPVVGVTSATFKVRKRGTTAWLAGLITMSSDRKRATLNPSTTLRHGKSYVVKLTTGIKDDNANSLVAKTWTFTVT